MERGRMGSRSGTSLEYPVVWRIGAGVRGVTMARRYNIAGRTSPSPRPRDVSSSFVVSAPSRVVTSAAKYADGVSVEEEEDAVDVDLSVDSRARRSWAGFFWCGRFEAVCGRIFVRKSSSIVEFVLCEVEKGLWTTGMSRGSQRKSVNPVYVPQWAIDDRYADDAGYEAV